LGKEKKSGEIFRFAPDEIPALKGAGTEELI
jgi:hypothetical protein